MVYARQARAVSQARFARLSLSLHSQRALARLRACAQGVSAPSMPSRRPACGAWPRWRSAACGVGRRRPVKAPGRDLPASRPACTAIDALAVSRRSMPSRRPARRPWSRWRAAGCGGGAAGPSRRPAARPPHRSVRSPFPHTAPTTLLSLAMPEPRTWAPPATFPPPSRSDIVPGVRQRPGDAAPARSGRRHSVTVQADGYVWEGKPYSSLSAVARAITGTAWSGPRFFALRSSDRSNAPRDAMRGPRRSPAAQVSIIPWDEPASSQ
jgi:hypothetical protein